VHRSISGQRRCLGTSCLTLRDRPLIDRKPALCGPFCRPQDRACSTWTISSPAASISSGKPARRDLEGIVGKWREGPYETDGVSTSWVKIKNPTYSQIVGRRGVFDARSDRGADRVVATKAPALRLHLPELHYQTRSRRRRETGNRPRLKPMRARLPS